MKKARGFLIVLLACTSPAVLGAAAQIQAGLPELSSKRLLNNLQVIVAHSPGSGDDMTIGWILRYGSAFDPAGKGGLAHLISQMLAKATLDKSAQAIEQELKYLDATLEVQCTWDHLSVLLRGHSSSFERALLLLYQVIGEAEFLQKDLDELKAQRLAQLASPEDPRQRMRSLLERELFAGTTWGRPLRGTSASLQNIALGDLRFFYGRYFSPAEASLVVVGPAPAELVLQKAARIWGVWVRKETIPFTFIPPRSPSSRTVLLEDDPQSPAAQFILGSLWPARGEISYYPAQLAARILQDRLTRILPTSLITVASEGRRMPGPFYILGQSAADQAMDQMQKILEAVEAFKISGCAQEELASARSKWMEEFRASLGTSEGICGALLDAELFRLGANYLAAFDDDVRRQSADAVAQAAKEWLLPGGALVLVHGPAATLRDGLSLIGSVRDLKP